MAPVERDCLVSHLADRVIVGACLWVDTVDTLDTTVKHGRSHAVSGSRNEQFCGVLPAVPSASAWSSRGRCLNFISPKIMTADVDLYRLLFSSSPKPSTSNAFYPPHRTAPHRTVSSSISSTSRQSPTADNSGRSRNHENGKQCEPEGHTVERIPPPAPNGSFNYY